LEATKNIKTLEERFALGWRQRTSVILPQVGGGLRFASQGIYQAVQFSVNLLASLPYFARFFFTE
jgi:hypothetical protein